MRILALSVSAAFALTIVAFVASRDGPVAAMSSEALPRSTPMLPRAMPRVTTPIGFALPHGCALTEGGQAVRTGQNGSLIHWIAACPDATPADTATLFGTELAKQGWTETSVGRLVSYRRADLELVFEFVAPSRPPTNYVWFAEHYWR